MEKEIKISIDDKEPKIAYINLGKESGVRSILIDPQENGEEFVGEIVLDLDQQGKIVGIEIIGDVLPDDLSK